MNLSEDFLRKELIENNLSIVELARKLNVKKYFISNAIQKYKLSEEIKIARFNRRSIVGNKYGRLLVIEYNEKDNFGKSTWKCVCECGNTVTVGITALTSGHTSSCGCLRKDMCRSSKWKGVGELSKDYFSTIENNAKSRHLEFNITMEFLWDLFLKQNRKCALSGIEISLNKNKRQKIYQTASLDRIDSSEGYTEDNVQWVDKDINLMKRCLINDDFIEKCYMVAKHNNKFD